MHTIYEFIFCPVHGIFAPANWVWLAPLFSEGTAIAKAFWHKAVN